MIPYQLFITEWGEDKKSQKSLELPQKGPKAMF
jgi:hypothetical protein